MDVSHSRSISLLFTALDLPLWSSLETVATLYPKAAERFDLLLTEPVSRDRALTLATGDHPLPALPPTPRLLWLELSPYRVALTVQGNGQVSYRHLWQQGVYGMSRYWLPSGDATGGQPALCLRNYTRSLQLQGTPLPTSLRVEYELWSEKVQLGHYVVSLEMRHRD